MYTYTLETIIQAGRNRIAITSVPIRTNGELRKSRLFKSMGSYMKSFMMYRPLKFFGIIAALFFIPGLALGIRFLVLGASGHVQSLILAAVLMMMGTQTFIMGLQADLISANRKLLEDIQYRVRKSDADSGKPTADLEINGKEE